MIGLFTSCKRMVNSYKCYTLIKDGSVRWPYTSSMGNVLTSC
jgi:hypothetical protein